MTANSAVSPSATGAASSMVRMGRLPPPPSLSLIVPRAAPSSIVAPSGSLSSTLKRSSASAISSSCVFTLIDCVSVPGGKVRVPDVWS